MHAYDPLLEAHFPDSNNQYFEESIKSKNEKLTRAKTNAHAAKLCLLLGILISFFLWKHRNTTICEIGHGFQFRYRKWKQWIHRSYSSVYTYDIHVNEWDSQWSLIELKRDKSLNFCVVILMLWVARTRFKHLFSMYVTLLVYLFVWA